MSYSDTRRFCETMRFLGYPRLISIESFHNPNFQLIAEILDWLVHRYDNSLFIPEDISTEKDRILFIKKVVEVLAVRARIKIHPKRLYAADRSAVSELLKVSSLLQQAMISASNNDVSPPGDFTVSSKISDLKNARHMASQITEIGANLHELLTKDKVNNDLRNKALNFLNSVSRNLDSTSEHESLEKAVMQIVARDEKTAQELMSTVNELEIDEQKLQSKIKKKQSD
eukprot:GHVL01031640.1.p1 GENE.GHVL01031640.1~~GHVL01031640.1.p1  ORF type:complete len:228 (-),score=43.52 GHVL01031640.1:521-1204(-)